MFLEMQGSRRRPAASKSPIACPVSVELLTPLMNSAKTRRTSWGKPWLEQAFFFRSFQIYPALCLLSVSPVELRFRWLLLWLRKDQRFRVLPVFWRCACWAGGLRQIDRSTFFTLLRIFPLTLVLPPSARRSARSAVFAFSNRAANGFAILPMRDCRRSGVGVRIEPVGVLLPTTDRFGNFRFDRIPQIDYEVQVSRSFKNGRRVSVIARYPAGSGPFGIVLRSPVRARGDGPRAQLAPLVEYGNVGTRRNSIASCCPPTASRLFDPGLRNHALALSVNDQCDRHQTSTLVVTGIEANGPGVTPSPHQRSQDQSRILILLLRRPRAARIEIAHKGGTPQFHGTRTSACATLL